MLRHRIITVCLAAAIVLTAGCAAARRPGPQAPRPSEPVAPGTPTTPAASTDTSAYDGRFLYIDKQRGLSLFDLHENRTVWSAPSGTDHALSPCWSEDGKYVVFTSASGSGDDIKFSLVYLSPFNGEELRVPLDPKMFEDWVEIGGECSVSPSGKYVAIDVPYGYRFVVDARTGETVYIMGGTRMFWAPDRDVLCEVYVSDGGGISYEPGMWYELKVTDIPAGESRSVLKGLPDHLIYARGWTVDGAVIYEEYLATARDLPPAIKDTAGRTYAKSPLKPAEVPSGVGDAVVCRGPHNGLWLLQVQDPDLVIWLWDEAKKSVIRAVEGSSPLWQPGR